MFMVSLTYNSSETVDAVEWTNSCALTSVASAMESFIGDFELLPHFLSQSS